jgi:Family of unknown function (DUF6338)
VDTFEALAVTIVGILPGAVSVWAYERNAGTWGLSSPDRLYRFVGASAAFGLLFAPLTYWIWSTYIHSGDIAQARQLPLYLWLVLALYGLVPALVGWIFGILIGQQGKVGNFLRSPGAPPRAWDSLFHDEHEGIVRLKLKSGSWIAGVLGRYGEGASYASAYPTPQDLRLAATVQVDAETGEYAMTGAGKPIFQATQILVDWSEVDYMLFDRKGGSRSVKR